VGGESSIKSYLETNYLQGIIWKRKNVMCGDNLIQYLFYGKFKYANHV